MAALAFTVTDMFNLCDAQTLKSGAGQSRYIPLLGVELSVA